MQPVADVKISCQCGSNQGICQCGSALDILLEKRIAAYWIKQPVTAHGSCLEAFGIQTSQIINHLGECAGWSVHYGGIKQRVIQEVFETPQQAFVAGLKWIGENAEKS
jgi:hypothetical protein